MQPEDLASDMATLATEAVEQARAYGVELDFSENSLADLEDILDGVFQKIPPGVREALGKGESDPTLLEHVMLWGSYFGEVARRAFEGKWRPNPEPGGMPALLIGNESLEPHARVFDHLIHGHLKRLTEYYLQVRERLMPPTADKLVSIKL